MRKTVEQVIAYANQMRKSRDLMRGIYQEAFDYCRPNMSEWSSETQGQEKQNDIYDDTAQESVGKFAARFQKAMIPNDSNWFKFELPEYVKNNIREQMGDIAAEDTISQIELDLERQSDTFFDYMHRSNLSIKGDEAFNDLAIGTLAMWINETDEQAMPFTFSSIPLHQSLFGEGEDGTVADVGREYQMEVQNVVSKWNNTGNISAELMELYKDSPTAKVDILEITCQDRINKVWDYYVIDVKRKHEIMKGQFKTNPALVLRYRRASSEVFGRGPCIFKLPTIRVLNTREELLLRSEHRTVGGIFLASDDGVLDPYTTQVLPETIIPVADVDRSLRELEYRGRIDIVEERRRAQQEEIRRAFFAQQFAGPMDPVRSATEISIMYQEMIEDMGGDFGRIRREFLDQLVARVTDILVRRGLMKEITIRRDIINYRYTSPLAKAQDTRELESVQNTLVMANQLLGPQAAMLEYNTSRVARAIGDYNGIDKHLLNTADEKEQLQQQMAQAAQAAQQQA